MRNSLTSFIFLQMLEAISAGVGLWQVGVTFEEPWIFRLRETPGGLREDRIWYNLLT